jgi:hypothetical protein
MFVVINKRLIDAVRYIFAFTSSPVVRVRLMVFNATFSNILVILWQSVLLVEETRVPGENHRPAASH